VVVDPRTMQPVTSPSDCHLIPECIKAAMVVYVCRPRAFNKLLWLQHHLIKRHYQGPAVLPAAGGGRGAARLGRIDLAPLPACR
jgi:hypothetical protein